MYHPMTGMKTKLKVHWYMYHNNYMHHTVVHVACGQEIKSGNLIYCDNINDITCLKCMDIATQPEKSIKDVMSYSREEAYC